MQLRVGSTRLVILVGRYAVKVAHLGFASFSYRLPTVYERIMSWLWANMTVAPVRTNLMERRLSQEMPDMPFAPTYFTFFGLVNVQRRGEPVTQEEIDRAHPLRDCLGLFPAGHDLELARNWCRIDGRFALCDYGHPPFKPLMRECRALMPFL